MEIIATTKGGFLIKADESEVNEILCSVTGEKPQEIKIGQKIPAIDYASTIKKVKRLAENSYYKDMMNKLRWFNESVEKIKEKVESASKIEI